MLAATRHTKHTSKLLVRWQGRYVCMLCCCAPVRLPFTAVLDTSDSTCRCAHGRPQGREAVTPAHAAAAVPAQAHCREGDSTGGHAPGGWFLACPLLHNAVLNSLVHVARGNAGSQCCAASQRWAHAHILHRAAGRRAAAVFPTAPRTTRDYPSTGWYVRLIRAPCGSRFICCAQCHPCCRLSANHGRPPPFAISQSKPRLCDQCLQVGCSAS